MEGESGLFTLEMARRSHSGWFPVRRLRHLYLSEYNENKTSSIHSWSVDNHLHINGKYLLWLNIKKGEGEMK